jgi:L-serine dehydratase
MKMHSIFDLFKIGIGPSSSHTVGPMVAAARFAAEIDSANSPLAIVRVQVELFGSLALTGRGHATDSAVLAGLSGLLPAKVEPDEFQRTVCSIRETKWLRVNGRSEIHFDEATDLIFHNHLVLPFHSNGMRFSAFDAANRLLLSSVYFSVGGGFVVREGDTAEGEVRQDNVPIPFNFTSAADLLRMGAERNLTIEQIVHANEVCWRSETAIGEQLDRLWHVMESCIERGCQTQGILPGGLGVRRRAPAIFTKLSGQDQSHDPLRQLDWVSLFALAVNEENAAGGKVVTAPTNGAAGVIPAVLSYYVKFVPGADRAGIHRFLKTAGAIGLLYKRNASLSAAEMGCQGEVGVACSMAAGGLAACMGGSNEQIENAAEIGMEHNLGLTCDPVRGLVQVPCIERNTMGAAKAINAARLAVLYGDGTHRVALDKVIETMRQTGIDMQTKYKETSLGGLAVNVVNC